MRVLAYAASHPSSTAALLLIGCGTFDALARAEFERTIAERMSPAIRAELERAKKLGSDETLKSGAKACCACSRRESIPLPLRPSLHRP